MKGYAGNEVFSAAELELLELATDVVECIPEGGWRCHEVVRAVARVIEKRLEVIDGHYGAVDHSWLAWSNGNRGSILDVYSVGRMPVVQLVDAYIPGAGATPYRPGIERDDIRKSDVESIVRSLLLG